MWKILNGLLLSKGGEHFKKWKCSLTKAKCWKTSSLTRRVMVENRGCLDVFLHYLDLITIESSWQAHQLTSVNHYLKSRARVVTFLFLVENIIMDSGRLVFMSLYFFLRHYRCTKWQRKRFQYPAERAGLMTCSTNWQVSLSRQYAIHHRSLLQNVMLSIAFLDPHETETDTSIMINYSQWGLPHSETGPQRRGLLSWTTL